MSYDDMTMLGVKAMDLHHLLCLLDDHACGDGPIHERVEKYGKQMYARGLAHGAGQRKQLRTR